MTSALILKAIEGAAPMVAALIIAVLTWFTGRKSARIEAENDALREEIKARERIADLIEEEHTHAEQAQEVARAAPSLRTSELSDAEHRDIFGYDRPDR